MAEAKVIDWAAAKNALKQIVFEKFIIVFAFVCIGIIIAYNIILNQAVSDYEVQCGTASSPSSPNTSITTKASYFSAVSIGVSALVAVLLIIGILKLSEASIYHGITVAAMLFTFIVMVGLAIGLNQTLSIDSNKKIIIGIAITVGFLSTLVEVILLMNPDHDFGGTIDKIIVLINSICLLTIGAVLLSENDSIKNDSTISNGLKTVFLGASITSLVLGAIGILVMFGWIFFKLKKGKEAELQPIE